MLLKEMRPAPADLIRPFWYPEDADSTTGIEVTLRYLSPEMRTEVEERVTLRLQRENTSQAPGDRRRALINEVLLEAVQRCKKATFRKLKELVPISADAVTKNGGLDAEIPMDPTDIASAAAARENLLYLLDHSEKFANWALTIASNISRFQASDWEDRVKNSSGGQGSNSDQTLSTST